MTYEEWEQNLHHRVKMIQSGAFLGIGKRYSYMT